MKYIALLRGINVGGNNKVPMSDLKQCFEELGYKNVFTYINSGNVIFETIETEGTALVRRCEEAIVNTFGFSVKVSVTPADEVHRALEHAPRWWGKEDGGKHNAIFVIAPATADQVIAEVGEAKPDYEKVAHYENIIFWTAPLKTFSRTRWSKIVGTKAYQHVTIRNANTTKKLAELTKGE
nr:protein of unknown function (DUF1697) [uncultured bacterium]